MEGRFLAAQQQLTEEMKRLQAESAFVGLNSLEP